MEKKITKYLKWEKKDVYLNIVVYFINYVIMLALFIGNILLNGKSFGELSSMFGELNEYVILSLLLFIVTPIYLYNENRDFLKNASNSEMMFLIIEVVIAVSVVCGLYVNPYLRPVALIALIFVFICSTRISLFFNCAGTLLLALFDVLSGSLRLSQFGGGNFSGLSFFFYGVLSGIIAIFLVRNVFSRIRLLLISFAVSVPALLCSFIISPIISGSGNEFNWVNLVSAVFSGPLAVTLCITLLPIFESLFNKVSYFRYSELSEHKSKLMRRLIEEAPGTFNHSLVVANIAEACAIAIDEDPLLVRTCAYYHDIGKLHRPEMFKENQSEGNPHNELTPELSVKVIKMHTSDGFLLAKKNRLPKEIADVCVQHHGTMPIMYFYDRAKQLTENEVNIEQFCYDGPKPQSKVAAIIMIADSSEAATRALVDHSIESVTSAVRGIIDTRLKLGQFDECEITLKELNIIAHTVISSLTGVYHKRIEYPKINVEEVAKENTYGTTDNTK